MESPVAHTLSPNIPKHTKKRTDIHTILLIGSGPIVIGQACEFDYSGTQAAKTLKSLGYRVVLINSNPATIMTDPDFADRTYIEPITEEVIANIIKQEKVDAILPTMGGQTALNVAMSMHERGMLEGVQFLGAKPEAIKKGEDRQAFKEAMLKIGMDLPKSRYAYNIDEALEAAKDIGFPLIIRASFTLAGGGSGVAYNIDEFKALAQNGLEVSPINEILIEESLLGWKEFEMEVIRDKNDNCIIVCSIENLDPMGVHTGDSITIAPALTLTDKEYQRMRDASFKILREIGVDTGGSNVQFAINPQNGRMTVIEMNPRVSRSSALASKATGYPIAKVATLLAVGYTLDEIKNDITGTPASFEPSIDYIVTKIPRFTFEKFPQADSTLTTSMKSIGEVMAIGGSFKESLQKALCSLETGIFGFNRISVDLELVKKEIRRPNANRLLYIAEGFGLGMSIDEVYDLCNIDRWFLHQIWQIVQAENDITREILHSPALMRKIKSYGFSDKMIAYWLKENDNIEMSESEVYQARQNLGIMPQYCEVDTCAGEFPSLTPYLYSTIGNFTPLKHSALSDKSLNLRSGLGHYPQGNSLHPSLDNNDLSSQILECQKPDSNSLANSSLGMQCDKIENFVRGTDAKSANLPQNFQNLHSHTANTRIYKTSGGESQTATESSCTDSVKVSESKCALDSETPTQEPHSAAGLEMRNRSFQGVSEGSYLSGSDRANDAESAIYRSKPTRPKKVLIIGGGPNRIGQGIEFDYCCVHASFALKDMGVQSIMYNCNPETVSTDYDTSDTLYFEPITFECVRSVIEREKPDGIIVHFGGQTPLKLANSLTKINANIIGTSAKVIDVAEDREKFAAFIAKLGLNQPENGIAFEKEQAYSIANKIGFPVLVRPSYVLGGRAMRIVYDDEELKSYMDEVIAVSDSAPILIDKFLEQAIEFDVDCISDGKDVYIGGIMQHIEEAGIHSGDSASCLPPFSIDSAMLERIESTTATIALKLGVVGLMNVQYAIYQDELYLIEVNPRASRTVPFVSKATGIPLAKVATRVMWQHSQRNAMNAYAVHVGIDCKKNVSNILLESLQFYDVFHVVCKLREISLSLTTHEISTHRIYGCKTASYCSIKESVFPFNKLPGADLLLGPEMKSTGEVMGIAANFEIAFAKSQLACKNPLPQKGKIFISLRNSDKKYAHELATLLCNAGFEIVATLGTHKILKESGISAISVLKVSEGRPHIIDMITNHEIAMVINTTTNKDKADARLIRQAVLRANIPYFTTISGARSAAIAMQMIYTNQTTVSNTMIYSVQALQNYLNKPV